MYTVYRHYDHEGTLLRVGCTSNLPKRNSQYKAKAPWWHQVARTETTLFKYQFDALQAELTAIQQLQPRHNNYNGRGKVSRKQLKAWAAKMGSKGGQAGTGKAKARDAAHYRAASQKRWKLARKGQKKR